MQRPVACSLRSTTTPDTAPTSDWQNCVSDRVACRVADLCDLSATQQFGVVTANIFAGVLCRFAAKVAGAVSERHGSLLILAGILTPQYGRVRRAYEARGNPAHYGWRVDKRLLPPTGT